jgi:hypothetical protein
MTAQDLLPWIPVGTSAFIAYLIAYIVNDFKDFKNDSKKEFKNLAEAREEALSSMRGLALEIGQKVAGLEVVHAKYEAKVDVAISKINLELESFGKEISEINKTAETAEAFFKKGYELAQTLNMKVNQHTKEIRGIQIQISKDAVMFKSKKP